MVFDQLTHQLGVLQNMLQNLEEGFYTLPVQHLASASIGAHTRHSETFGVAYPTLE
jgi:hypothetical protein